MKPGPGAVGRTRSLQKLTFRIVTFQIRSGDPQNESAFRKQFAPIREINDRHGCEKITILKGADPGAYAYISQWRDLATLDILRESPEYIAFVSELLKCADIVSDKIYEEEVS